MLVPDITRRKLLLGGATLAAAAALPTELWGETAPQSPIRLGVASYSFRKFGRTDVIKFMKELDTPYLNVKDVHLPMGSSAEIKQASDEFRESGIQLTAAGTIYFTKDDDDDMRRKFDYCKVAGIPLIVAGPTPGVLPRLEKFAKQYDMKIAIHNHGPEGQVLPFSAGRIEGSPKYGFQNGNLY